MGRGRRRRMAGLDDSDAGRAVVADRAHRQCRRRQFLSSPTCNRCSLRAVGQRRTYLDEAGHGDRIQRQDRAGHPGFGAGLGTVRRADRARRRAQRPLSRLGRHRHRDVGLLRRSGRDADDEPHRRTRCAALAVPHHRAVLADPGVAADRAQRHHRRHGHHRGVHRRLPELQRAHPADTALLSEVLAERGLQHLLRRQVAPDPAGGVESRGHQAALAAVSRIRAVLRLHGRRDRPVVSRPGLRQPPGQPAGHARRGLSPVEGPRRQDDRVHPRRQGDRTGQAVVHATSAPAPGMRRTTCSRSGPTSTRPSSTWATSATARSCWRTRRSSASCRRTPNCRRSTRISTSRVPTASRGRRRTPCGRGTR